MTIERGANWGDIVTERTGGLSATGDLARDLGLPSQAVGEHPGPWLRLPLDAIDIVAVDSRGRHHERTISSWMLVGKSIRGEYAIVSSTSFVEGRRIFSRAHPNDGRLDWLALDSSMTLRQRVAFRRRTRSETHLPHPLVTVGAGSTFAREFLRPVTIRFESAAPVRAAVKVAATIRPDALVTHIPSS